MIKISYSLSPFGMLMPGRSALPHDYRFGFNGQEMSNELKGEGNSNTAEYWEYDTRLGKRWNIDPVVKEWLSPFSTFANNPISQIDPLGLTEDWYERKNDDGSVSQTWQPGNEATINVDGQEYKNVGENAIIKRGEDEYFYQQNECISVNNQNCTDANGEQLNTALSGTGFTYTTVNPEQQGQQGINYEQFQLGIEQNMSMLKLAEYVCEYTPGICIGGMEGIAANQFVSGGSKLLIEQTAAIQAGKAGTELFNFGKIAAGHMANSGRKVPIQILDDVIKNSKGLVDPGGSKALMHYSQIWKNGKLYNLEVLYDKASNSIWHFQYSRDAMGPLLAIPK